MRVIQASAPARCGILGNPSDIYGGFVLSCSVPARAVCRLTLGESGPLPEDTRLLDAALARFPLEGDWKVEWSTAIPRSSGLSGSTALLAATLACILTARGEAYRLADDVAMGELVRDVERNEADIMCGYQDAQMIVHGGLQWMNFAGKHPAVPGPHPQLTSLQSDLPFLLVTTGVERLSGSVHGPMAQRWMDGEEEVVSAIEAITQMGRQAKDWVISSDWDSIASAMDENHRLVASLGGSGEPIDRLIELAKKHGAKAAKLAGAGLGGTVIALTHQPDELEAKLRGEGYSRFLRPQLTQGLRLDDLTSSI